MLAPINQNKYYTLPRYVRFVSIIFLFLTLFILPNRIVYRFFEVMLFLFLVLETKSLLYGSIGEYILLSTIEVGKNFSYTILHIPIIYPQFQYFRDYQAAFVFLDSDLLLLFIIGLIFLRPRGAFSISRLRVKSFDLLYMLFFILVCVSTLFSSNFDNSMLGFLQVIRGLVIYFLFRFLPLKKILSLLPLIFITILLIQSTLGILQYFKKSPLGLIFEIGKYTLPTGIVQQEGVYTFFRPTGTFTEPNLYALILNMLIPLCLVFLSDGKNGRWKYYIGLISLASATLAVLLSYSRMGWFLYAVNLVILFILFPKARGNFIEKGKKIYNRLGKSIISAVFLLMIVGLAYLTFPRLENILISTTSKWGSFNARIFLVFESIKIISFYPWFGVGLFNFVPVLVDLSALPLDELYLSSVHNIYLLIASEVGMLALLVFIIFFVSLYYEYIKIQRLGSQNERTLQDSLGLSVFCFLFGGLFLSYFYAGIQFVFLNIILGLFANIITQNSFIIDSDAKKNSLRHHTSSISIRYGRKN